MYICLLPELRRLALSDARRILLFDVAGEEARPIAEVEAPCLLSPFSASSAGERMCASPVGLLARSLTPEGQEGHWTRLHSRIGLYRAEDLREVAQLDAGRRLDPRSLALSADGTRLASVTYGEGAVLFDAASGALLGEAEGDIGSGVSFSPDGRWLALGETDQGGGDLTLLDLAAAPGAASGAPPAVEPTKHNLPRPKSKAPLYDSPFCSIFSPDGQAVYFTSKAWGLAGVAAYEVGSKEERWSHAFSGEGEEEEEHWDAPELDLALGGALVLVGEEGVIRGYRTSDGEPLGELRFEPADSACFAADSERRGVWIAREGKPERLPFPEDWSEA